tara:strand:- start:184 stop:480 length:297 start_codon:yes stop_codon:yes gene_type:complete
LPKNDLLFGKPLQSLVEKALTNLNNSNVETVIVSDIITQIFQDKPDLLVLVKNTQQKKNLYKRVFHVCNSLSKVNFIKMEKKSNRITSIFYIIYTKTI